MAVLGPGSIGTYVASKMHRAGYETMLIGKESNRKLIQEGGYRIRESIGNEYTFLPNFSTKLEFRPDILFITSKYQHLEDALDKTPRDLLEKTLILPLLNGFLHYDLLRKRLGNNVLTGTIGGIDARKNGRELEVKTSKLEISMASALVQAPKLEQLENVIREAGIPVIWYKSEKEVIWGKFARLSIISSLTAAAQRELGFVRTNDYWRNVLEQMLKEVADVAIHDGFVINKQDVLDRIDSLPEGLNTSLQRDVAQRRPSELDAITGAVIQLGKKYRIDVTYFEMVYDQIKSHYTI